VGDIRITFEYAGRGDPNDLSMQDLVSLFIQLF